MKTQLLRENQIEMMALFTVSFFSISTPCSLALAEPVLTGSAARVDGHIGVSNFGSDTSLDTVNQSGVKIASGTDSNKDPKKDPKKDSGPSSKSVSSDAAAADTEGGDDQPTVVDRNVSPEKKALIEELLKVTEADKNAQAMSDQIIMNNQKQLPVMMAKVINSDSTLSTAQKKTMISRIDESSERTAKRLKEIFDEKINLPKVLNEVALNVYDKYFSDSELKDIIAFYKSPTGQKSMKVLPQVTHESLVETTKILMPKMESVLMQVLQEERDHLSAGESSSKG